MLTQPQYVTINDMPFLIRPLEKVMFEDKDVIYIILCLLPGGETYIIDVGQSGETGAPPMNTPRRRQCWEDAARGPLLVGAHRPATDFNMAQDRLKMVRELRAQYRPPCSGES